MKRSELKQIIKECVKEVMVTEKRQDLSDVSSFTQAIFTQDYETDDDYYEKGTVINFPPGNGDKSEDGKFGVDDANEIFLTKNERSVPKKYYKISTQTERVSPDVLSRSKRVLDDMDYILSANGDQDLKTFRKNFIKNLILKLK